MTASQAATLTITGNIYERENLLINTYFVFLNCACLILPYYARYYNMEYEVTSSITIKIITQTEIAKCPVAIAFFATVSFMVIQIRIKIKNHR